MQQKDNLFLAAMAILCLSPLWVFAGKGLSTGTRSETTTASPIPSKDAPKFQKHDCFHRDGVREPWESGLPDGIIAWRGYNKYLVILRDETEKRGGGPKWSQELTIAEFDARHHYIACPFEWLNHNLKGRK